MKAITLGREQEKLGEVDFETAVREDVEKAPIMGERMGLLVNSKRNDLHRLRLAAPEQKGGQEAGAQGRTVMEWVMERRAWSAAGLMGDTSNHI